MTVLDGLKRLIPRPLKAIWWSYVARRDLKELAPGRSAEEIFTAVYRRGHWGKSGDPAQSYYSGSGSHDAEVVGRYVAAVKSCMAGREDILNAVDLGCGDFAVGSQLRPLFKGYTACDVVPGLIERNRQTFGNLDVDFRRLDMSKDPLPAGDIVFIRQVLQHLSNEDIQSVVSKVKRIYRYLVLTEHLPATQDFVANMDHTTGRDVRVATGSGVVLTAPPFNLSPKSEKILCEVPEDSGVTRGIIRTYFYELQE